MARSLRVLLGSEEVTRCGKALTLSCKLADCLVGLALLSSKHLSSRSEAEGSACKCAHRGSPG